MTQNNKGVTQTKHKGYISLHSFPETGSSSIKRPEAASLTQAHIDPPGQKHPPPLGLFIFSILQHENITQVSVVSMQ